MIRNNDLILLLTEMEENNNHAEEAGKYIRYIINKPDVSLEVLKFINDNRQLDVSHFFEKLRRSYNAKKSKLYINLMRDITDENVSDIITTLSSYLLQVNIFSKTVSDQRMFFLHSRAEEVSRALNTYYKTMEVSMLIKLLKAIKCDILAFNSIKG